MLALKYVLAPLMELQGGKEHAKGTQVDRYMSRKMEGGQII